VVDLPDPHPDRRELLNAHWKRGAQFRLRLEALNLPEDLVKMPAGRPVAVRRAVPAVSDPAFAAPELLQP
jgi:hypothetical protein